MWNMKYENARHIPNNATIASYCWICQQFNCKHLLLAIYTLSYLISKCPSFFLVDFEQAFYEIFFVWKSSFHFIVSSGLWNFFAMAM